MTPWQRILFERDIQNDVHSSDILSYFVLIMVKGFVMPANPDMFSKIVGTDKSVLIVIWPPLT